ncbi:peptidylprolyl isomerase [Nitrosomonas sp.]|uniref:peptidylprolyl isomerase n=1 Tax=Nitrosomonas sp. TaxID=42353 RepID=UPI0025D15D6C|nr:peptidylprolyl isomerase [Nitrosomonas sp.]
MAQANSVACFSSNMGQFCIELFDTQTPVTTANFLQYIDSGAYTNGIFHRSVPGFVIQGGGFKIVDGTSGKSLAAVNTFSPIINEFKISNTRGTVAMAKLGSAPNSATSQWFVNLADNSANLDHQNGGFTVFGRVLFDGMTVFDAIAKLKIANLGGSLNATPTINASGAVHSTDDLVQINHVETVDVTGVFSDGILSFPVDIGTGQPYTVNLKLISSKPDFVFQLDPASVAALPVSPGNIATFSSGNGQLHIPSVMIGPTAIVKNILMRLTDAGSYTFTLVSYE